MRKSDGCPPYDEKGGGHVPCHKTLIPLHVPCRFPLTPHEEPRYSSFADKEAQAALIYLTFKRPRRQLTTPAEYLSFLEEELFESCCNERLFKISRENDPPFYTGSVRPGLGVQGSIYFRGPFGAIRVDVL